MPELTHDAEDGFHEIQLSGKQLVFLFMATTLVSVLIFLCGVLVGRGVRAERGGEEAISASAAPAAPATDTAPSTVVPPPSPPPEQPLTYDKTLRDAKPPADTLKKAPETPPAAAQNPPPATAAQQPAPAAAPPAATEKPATTPPARADVPSSGRPGTWVIQVHALQNRDAATTFVRTLASKGYPAFLLNPAAGSPQIYRVQIGGYRDRGEAEQVARRLEKEEQFKPAIKRR